jgi:hypothetical protein
LAPAPKRGILWLLSVTNMAGKIIFAILAVAACTSLFSWAISWFVCATWSKDQKAQRRARIVDGLTSLGLALYYVVQAIRGKEPKLAGIMCGLLIGFWLILWLIRSAKSLLRQKA